MRGVCMEMARAVALMPTVPAVMTSAFEAKRGGILVHRVMVCAEEPLCIAVAVPKGHRVATLIRDSHGFCLNLVDPKQRLLIKKFEHGAEPDTFELLEHRVLATGSPCLTRALACLDCDVMRHFDLEADHEMYVGQVMRAWVPAKPAAAPCTNGHGGSKAGGHGQLAVTGNGALGGMRVAGVGVGVSEIEPATVVTGAA